MPLANTATRNALPGEKFRKLVDGAGMYLEITPGGRRGPNQVLKKGQSRELGAIDWVKCVLEQDDVILDVR